MQKFNQGQATASEPDAVIYFERSQDERCGNLPVQTSSSWFGAVHIGGPVTHSPSVNRITDVSNQFQHGCYMELHHAARNNGTKAMNISRTIAITLVGLSIGFGATSANAGFLSDVVRRVAEVKQGTAPQQYAQVGTASPYSWMSNKGYMDCLHTYQIFGRNDAEKQQGVRSCTQKYGSH
ncbi:hypothetical protein [Bradyrhizobium sp. 21]|uniref:hypothetical protein n=1 Tax=Bradyrhizobium sp. 21 TaxID=2782666 RepID=UPI001FF7EF92|nr:hypothetical protein [Bradyrhizobium sp. 21]MCK1386335.1 hypothetical protein [Bradyrhizobium sp. 21]